MTRNPRPAIAAADSTVTAEFDQIGTQYDRLTGMSPGYAAQLLFSARLLVRRLARRPARGAAPLRVADLGCGSGASTLALVRAFEEAGIDVEIDAVDGSAGMLAAAQTKQWPPTVTFRLVQAEDLVADGPRYDAVLCAYLVRNVPDKDAFLRTVHALIRPGGVLVVHDYGVAGRPVDTAAWTALCWGIIIPSAWVVTRRPQLFSYLWRSVLAFDTDERLRRRLADVGFVEVGQRAVPGWQRGMVRTTWGWRP